MTNAVNAPLEMGVGGEGHAPADIPPGKRADTHFPGI
jgi:hypothetical protein